MLSDKLVCNNERELNKAKTMATYITSYNGYVRRIKVLLGEIFVDSMDGLSSLDIYKPINIVFAINRGWQPDYYVSVMLNGANKNQ